MLFNKVKSCQNSSKIYTKIEKSAKMILICEGLYLLNIIFTIGIRESLSPPMFLLMKLSIKKAVERSCSRQHASRQGSTNRNGSRKMYFPSVTLHGIVTYGDMEVLFYLNLGGLTPLHFRMFTLYLVRWTTVIDVT